MSRPAAEIERARALISTQYAAEHVVLLDSGRSALQVALDVVLSGRGARRVVGLPAFQCFDVAAAAVGANAQIALYDIDPTTLAPDLASLERLVQRGVSVIVIAPLYGLPVDWDAVASLLERHGAIAIEDAAQGGGATWRGRALGSLGDVSILSFGRGKGWTGGGGGAICARGSLAPAFATTAGMLPSMKTSREIRVIATAFMQWVAGRPSLYGVPAAIPALELGETRYHPPAPATQAAAFSAALLCGTFAASRREVEIRRRNAAEWQVRLPAQLSTSVPRVASGAAPGYLRYPVRVAPRQRARADLRAERRAGIAPSYPAALSSVAAVAERRVHPDISVSGAEALARELLTLPTHSLLTHHDRAKILSLCGKWSPGAN
jgi:dTDP-4-amino-4,6-dideoxygalactose transaminase